jgi:hypothetical protein
MNCPHCTAPLRKVGDYVPPTCGKSECQEAEFRANQARTTRKKLGVNLKNARAARTANVCPNCQQPDQKNDHYDSLEGNRGGYTCSAPQRQPLRLKPKEGALKADGTRWTSQPGGIEKLEIRNGPDDPWFNNELQFARTLVEIMAMQSIDEAQWLVMEKNLQKALGMTESQVTSIFMRANDVVRKNRGQA